MEVTVIGIRRGSDFLEVNSLRKTSKNGRRAYVRIFLNFRSALHVAVKEIILPWMMSRVCIQSRTEISSGTSFWKISCVYFQARSQKIGEVERNG